MNQFQAAEPVYTTALGVQGGTETHFLFQKWSDTGWSKGTFCETLDEALAEQADYEAMREERAEPTRIIKVVTSSSFECLVQ